MEKKETSQTAISIRRADYDRILAFRELFCDVTGVKPSIVAIMDLLLATAIPAETERIRRIGGTAHKGGL